MTKSASRSCRRSPGYDRAGSPSLRLCPSGRAGYGKHRGRRRLLRVRPTARSSKAHDESPSPRPRGSSGGRSEGSALLELGERLAPREHKIRSRGLGRSSRPACRRRHSRGHPKSGFHVGTWQPSAVLSDLGPLLILQIPSSPLTVQAVDRDGQPLLERVGVSLTIGRQSTHGAPADLVVTSAPLHRYPRGVDGPEPSRRPLGWGALDALGPGARAGSRDVGESGHAAELSLGGSAVGLPRVKKRTGRCSQAPYVCRGGGRQEMSAQSTENR